MGLSIPALHPKERLKFGVTAKERLKFAKERLKFGVTAKERLKFCADV